MTRQQSEGEVHVAAMRLILAAMERSEDPPDWTIWQHMLSMLETIFQGIEDQRSDDQDELCFTRQSLDAKQAEMLGAVGYLREDRDYWKQARQDAHEAGELLLKCTQTLQAEIDTLRQQLANAQREASDEFTERQVLQHEASDDYVELARLREFAGKARKAISRAMNYCDVEFLFSALAELDAGTAEPTPVAEPAPCPELERLREMLHAAQFDNRNLKHKREAAIAVVTLQDAEIRRLRAFVATIKAMMAVPLNGREFDEIGAALAALDAGTSEPTPVAEPLDAESGA